jgi:oxygen-independent coproporphyrinogen-3 oxidase
VIPAHVYVHVPFCVRRCSYCDFAVTALRDPPVPDWLECVGRELGAYAGEERGELRTLYVGGGTPSLLGTGAMAGLATTVFRQVRPASTLEFTAEANPESFTAVLAEDWRRSGVNRVSLGAQTFHPEALRWMGRLHGPEGPGRALAAARAAGFDNVSVDLIFGLPERLGRDWAADLDRALALEPEHISLYGLTAETATPLGKWVAEGRERLADEDRYREEYLYAAETLTRAGYVHYEVSNFARPGLESRHNRAYWEGVPYLGLGPGAHSYLPPRRLWNTRDWAAYRERVLSGRSAVDGEEEVEASAATLERLWLGLRVADGLQDLTERQRAVARTWNQRGWAELAGGGVRLTAEGWLLLDRLVVELDAA